jgi:hypothetical protein
MTSLTAIERTEHRTMMLDPRRWPYWPWLPVKHITRDVAEFGAIYADDTDEGKPVRVFMRNMGTAPPEERERTFLDVDGVLDAGWRVD